MAFWQQETMSQKTSDLVFLMDIGSQRRFPRTLSQGQRLLLDGPYNQDFGLEDYDVVVLVAEGPGITKVLPYMTTLAARRAYDKRNCPNPPLFRDQTRRVDLFWWLKDDDEAAWVQDQLEHLQSLDPDNVGQRPRQYS